MKRVLIAPLDWGLGHATRCMPVIRELLNRNIEVLMAGSGASLALLKMEFPALRSFEIPGYHPEYPRAGSMVLKMVTQLPKFFKTIESEHVVIEKIIHDESVDVVISDNRYGCWSGQIPSVFITHQSNILMPKRFGWAAGYIRRMNVSHMKKFTRCWIPDFPGDHSLAGDLISFGKIKEKINVEFVGAISRFRPSVTVEKKYDIVAICSGPEPQRSLMEELVSNQLQGSSLQYFLVRGTGASSIPAHRPHTAQVLASAALREIIESSEVVLARSGYSTIMDLAALGKKAILIPTPGQTEQEYLAQRLSDRRIAFSMKQNKFDLDVAWSEVPNYSGFQRRDNNHQYLRKAIDNLNCL
jgi:uncharacterized protein (TIGR00661 family)